MKFSKLDSHDVIQAQSESRMLGGALPTVIWTHQITTPEYRVDAVDQMDDARIEPATDTNWK